MAIIQTLTIWSIAYFITHFSKFICRGCLVYPVTQLRPVTLRGHFPGNTWIVWEAFKQVTLRHSDPILHRWYWDAHFPVIWLNKEITQLKLKATLFHLCKIGSSCLSVICPNPNLLSVTCVNGAQSLSLKPSKWYQCH